MPDTKTMLRDTGLLSVILIGLLLILAGPLDAVATAAGAALGVFNFFLISRLVARLTAGVSNGGQFAAGLILKSFIGLGLLFALLTALPGGPVMLGVGAVVFAISIRSVAGLFAAPVPEV